MTPTPPPGFRLLSEDERKRPLPMDAKCFYEEVGWIDVIVFRGEIPPKLLLDLDYATALPPAEPTDSEMLDWLERNASDFECTSDATDFAVIVAKCRNNEHGPIFSHATLRAAIRAAMKTAVQPPTL